MQLALVDGKRQTAYAGGLGTCEMCLKNVRAKCGTKVVHHWAHERTKNCDPWWENETPWHREWKQLYPEACREIVHRAEDGEIHRADVRTQSGIYIEFQHSAISDAERMSRENFYRNLVWILDGRSFAKQFEIYHKLPAPGSLLAQDIIWFKARKDLPGCQRGMFHRQSVRNADTARFGGPSNMSQLFILRDIEAEVEASYVGHHQYDWVRPRSTWLSAACPVYIDFGTEWSALVRLERYGGDGIPCVRLIDKLQFVDESMSVNTAQHIANGQGRTTKTTHP